MTFDNNFEENFSKISNKKNVINILINNFLGKFNKFIFNPFIYLKIRKKIKKINPDKIILNNVFYSPITQMKALRGYEVYQIIHDYGIICPKSTAINENKLVCGGYKKSNCLNECKYHYSKIQLILKLYITKKLEKLRKVMVKKCISPSECLNKYLLDYDYNSNCINNPIKINKELEYSSIKFYRKKFIYVGRINENKGIFNFLESFIEFSKNKNVEIELVGEFDSNNDKNRLQLFLDNSKKIKYIGKLDNSIVMQKIADAYCIVVPSLWIENYPTTVLEAQIQKTLVIGSNRGGIPEMLNNNRGFTFNILNKEEIIMVLDKVLKLDEKEYIEIVEKAYSYVNVNNSFNTYYNKLIEVLNK